MPATKTSMPGRLVNGRPGLIVEAACWAHGRRKFFELAELQKAPVAIEAVRRIDELFAIEREIRQQLPDQRRGVRRMRSKPLVDALAVWLCDERRKLSTKSPVAKAIDYSLKRWPAFTRFLDDDRICMSNNAAERSIRGIAWTPARGSPTSSPASPTTQPAASPNCCPGTGRSLSEPEGRTLRPCPNAYFARRRHPRSSPTCQLVDSPEYPTFANCCSFSQVTNDEEMKNAARCNEREQRPIRKRT